MSVTPEKGSVPLHGRCQRRYRRIELLWCKALDTQAGIIACLVQLPPLPILSAREN